MIDEPEVSTVSPRPTIVLLVSCLLRGGAETQAVRLAIKLAGRGWSVKVASLLPPRDFEKELNKAGIPVVDYGLTGILSLPGSFVRLVNDLRSNAPDILVTLTYQANVIGKIAGRMAGVPVVVSSFRSEWFGSKLRDRLEAWTGRLHPVTSTNSATVAKALCDRGVADPLRLEVVPNAVPAWVEPNKTEKARARTELGAGADDFLWIAVGRTVPAKDYSGLIRAFASVVAKSPKARLAILGTGSGDADLTQSVAEAGLSDQVCLAGLRHDVPVCFSASDAYVLSSAWEGMPNTLLEAMASGLPVVTTRVGGAAGPVEETGCGLVVSPGDPAALESAMLAIMNQTSAQQAEQGISGRDFIHRHHDIVAVTDRWIEVFQKAARRSGRPKSYWEHWS